MMKIFVTYSWDGYIDGIVSQGSGITVMEAPKQFSSADDFNPIIKALKGAVDDAGMGVEEPNVHILQIAPLSSISPGFPERHPALFGVITGVLFGLTFWLGAGMVHFLQ